MRTTDEARRVDRGSSTAFPPVSPDTGGTCGRAVKIRAERRFEKLRRFRGPFLRK
jgi:hypothetical protein